MAYSARILKDSIGPNGVRLTSFEVSFPRIVLAEWNTHRVFSRNSASSRAIPVEKMIQKVLTDPFIPIYWGKNQKGMVAEEELSLEQQELAKDAWLIAAGDAVKHVRRLTGLDGAFDFSVHKQIANRLLEPFLWQTCIVTATEWDNFFALRCHKDAQPEIRKAAKMMKALYKTAAPTALKPGEWHLPLVDDYDKLMVEGFKVQDIVQICIGRCTRVSYLTHLGVRDPQADIDLAAKLQANGHMSPFEHAAMCLTTHETQWSGNLRGWLAFRKTLSGESVFQGNSQDD